MRGQCPLAQTFSISLRPSAQLSTWHLLSADAQALQACFGSSQAAVRKQLLDLASLAVPAGGTLAQQRAGLLALLAGEYRLPCQHAAGRIACAACIAKRA